jgi:hypothetical protein
MIRLKSTKDGVIAYNEWHDASAFETLKKFCFTKQDHKIEIENEHGEAIYTAPLVEDNPLILTKSITLETSQN